MLEEASNFSSALTTAVSGHQAKGFQIAIDDFGVGSSNFDRVWGVVKPDFVKLDRSLIQHATLSRNDHRVAKSLVAMLHGMGVMVVAEGIETAGEALAVMDADVDFVQGYYFARPATNINAASNAADEVIQRLWPELSGMIARVEGQERTQLAAVRFLLTSAKRALEAGFSFEEAAALLFAAPNTLSIFQLDRSGYQVGKIEYRDGMSDHLEETMRPILGDQRANWSRRAYFKDAIRRPSRFSLHGPRRALCEAALTYTTAVTYEVGDALNVLCVNFQIEHRELKIDGTITQTSRLGSGLSF